MDPTAEQARAIAASGYIFLFPLVVNYIDLYAEVVDPSSPDFSGGIGRWVHRRQARSQESEISIRHRTSLSSSVWLDLREGPWRLSTPASTNRLIRVTDLWGFVIHESGGSVPEIQTALIAPHGWLGEAPPGIGVIVRAETDLVRCTVYVELPDPGNLDIVQEIQRGFIAEPTDDRPRGSSAPTPPGSGWWPVDAGTLTTNGFWQAAAFALALVTPIDEDRGILEQLAEIGVAPGAQWNPEAFRPELLDAIEDGMDDALTDLLRDSGRSRVPGGRSRSDFDRDYFSRAIAAVPAQAFSAGRHEPDPRPRSE